MDLEESSNRRIGDVSFVEQVILVILSFLEDTHSNSPLGSWSDCYVCMSFRPNNWKLIWNTDVYNTLTFIVP